MTPNAPTLNPITQSGRWLRRTVLPLLANLKLAIALLLLIALFSIAGTVIEQGQTLAFYQENYPESPALFGFLTWKLLLGLGLNQVYRTSWFYGLLILFGSSLAACTFTHQLPALKVARRWKYYDQPRQFQKLALSAQLELVQSPGAIAPGTDGEGTDGEGADEENSLASLARLLKERRYQVFQAGDRLYARRGLVGRIGPIIVHASMLLVLAGAIWGSLTGFFAQEMVTAGETFRVRNIFEAGPLAGSQIPKDWGIKVNRFWIDYSPSGVVEQFYSDLSVVNQNGDQLDRQTIQVNKPLRYDGVTFYQADWGLGAAQVQLNRSPILQLPMQVLDTGGRGKLWGTFVPTKPDLSEGVSLIAKDLQGTVLLYDMDGKLIRSLRTGMATEVNGVTLRLVDVIGSTGLQIKADPGIPLVYLGFGLLMISTLMSYVSHAQIWALVQPSTADRLSLYLGGRTNRAQVTFERELVGIADQLIAAQDGSATAIQGDPVVSEATLLQNARDRTPRPGSAQRPSLAEPGLGQPIVGQAPSWNSCSELMASLGVTDLDHSADIAPRGEVTPDGDGDWVASGHEVI
ncbi:MAG: cytochrome c biogenesis protein [Synechococcales cyanobacterium RM1_1_8]|nr:cytochrome c biogenesis protein [Synechococcales cyanobacterium RM1_1_8]